MESENTEIPLHTDVKTEVEAINQEQTNSMLICLKTETLQENHVMEHELYNGVGTQQDDTGHDIRPEDNQNQEFHQNHSSKGDMKHGTNISSGLLPRIKVEGDTVTENYPPFDTQGMLIKSESWSPDTGPDYDDMAEVEYSKADYDMAEDSKAGVKFENQMPVRALSVTCPTPIVIQPEQPVFTQPNTPPTGSLSTASECQPSSSTNTLCSDTGNVSTLPIQRLRVKEPFQCSVCDKAFTCNSDLFYHERTHTADKQFKCPVCGKGFTKQIHLISHEKKHKDEKPSYKCDVCEKKFDSTSHLKAHLRTHTGEKPYKCTICGKDLATRTGLTCHVRTHTGEKPYKCTICGQEFIQGSNLTIHQRKHTGEKPYKCTECEMAFTSSVSLSCHQRIHTGEKPFKCTVCDKGLSSHSSLTYHMRIHTGEKPFPCSFCDKRFNQPTHLHRHMTQHTGEKPYKCDSCDKGYTRRSLLLSHKKKVHTDEEH